MNFCLQLERFRIQREADLYPKSFAVILITLYWLVPVWPRLSSQDSHLQSSMFYNRQQPMDTVDFYLILVIRFSHNSDLEDNNFNDINKFI